VLLLLGSLTLSGVLAYQAQDAVRSHRAASERTLRHYASLANWELRSGLDREFEDLIEDFREAADVAGPTRRQSADALEEFAEEIWDEADDCECPEALHGFFALDQRSGRIETLEGELAPEFAQWVRDSLAREAANPAPAAAAEAAQWRAVGRGRVGRADVHIRGEVPGLPAGTSLVFVTAREPHRADAPVFGFLVDVPRHAVGFTRQVLASTVLLPPSLIGDLQIDDLLAIDLAYDRTGTVFEAGEPVTSEAQVTDTLATALGSFTLSITIRPELAERLVIGGLPRSRLPLLAGIFALTLGLSAIAVVQLRREQDIVRTRGRFIASVSHELRTPLAQIRLFAELLGNDRLREEQRSRSVRVINEEAQRLTFLVENILRFSRAEQHKDRISPERTEMTPLVREIIAGFAPLAAGRGTAFRTQVREETFASVDRDAFRQILLNLLDNAAKYGPPRQTVEVGVDLEGDRVRLWVDDEGPGIPVADRKDVWEPYTRLARSVEASTGGSGIGLAVVRELVELHGGSVAVEEAPTGGARVIARFPAEPAGTPDQYALMRLNERDEVNV
jgi:signal transduction histidine kinase